MGIVSARSNAWNNGVQISYKLLCLSRAKTGKREGGRGRRRGSANPVVLFVLVLFNEQKNVTVALTLGRRCYATTVHKTQKIAFSPRYSPSLSLSLKFPISFTNFRIKFKLIQLRIISRLIFLVT